MDTTRYEEWLLARGLSEGTIYNYRGRVEAAFRIAGERGWELDRMTASQIRSLAACFPETPSSQRILRTALSHYWRMVGVDCPAEAIDCPKPALGRYRGLTEPEAEAIERTAVDRWPDGTAVLLGLYLALRREEMARLQWDHFTTDLEWVTILGKGHRYRELPVHPTLRTHLARQYQSGFLFPGQQRPHVHTGTVRKWIGRVGVDAGIGYVNPHALRHTCLSEMNDRTGDLRITQHFAGHADPQTTSRYTRTTTRRLLAAVASLDYKAA